MRRTLALSALISVVLTGTAHAKGAEPPPVEKYVRVGQPVRATTKVHFQHRREIGEWVAGGPYFAYLSRGWDGRPRRDRPVESTARLLGPVVVGAASRTDFGSWLVNLSVHFVAEGFSPGRYRLDVCTTPCTRASDHLYLGKFQLVRTGLEKNLRMTIDDLQSQITFLSDSIDRMNSEVTVMRPVTKRISSFTTGRIAEQDARIDELTAALQKVRRAAGDRPFRLAEAGLGFLAGALVLPAVILARRRIHRRPRNVFGHSV